MRINIYQKIFSVFLLLLFCFWLFLFLHGIKSGFFNYLYSFLFGLIPLFGGIIAMINAKYWGFLKSAIGKAVFFTGLGLFCWGSGETIWSYYNFFLNVAAPYPSLADLGFAPSIFFYGIGAIFLSKATGAKYGLRNTYAKLSAAVLVVIVTIVSYYLLVKVARGGVVVPQGETLLKAILDIAYPLGDFVSLTLSAVISSLSFKYFGGKFKFDIFSILLGLAVMFTADTVFSYTTTVNTYYNADFGDLLLTLGVFLLTFGILGFYKIKD